jgi:hypothetical protein
MLGVLGMFGVLGLLQWARRGDIGHIPTRVVWGWREDGAHHAVDTASKSRVQDRWGISHDLITRNIHVQSLALLILLLGAASALASLSLRGGRNKLGSGHRCASVFNQAFLFVFLVVHVGEFVVLLLGLISYQRVTWLRINVHVGGIGCFASSNEELEDINMGFGGGGGRRRSLWGRPAVTLIVTALFILGPAELVLGDVLDVGVVVHGFSVLVGRGLSVSCRLLLGIVLLVVVGMAVLLFLVVLLVFVESTLVLLVFGHATGMRSVLNAREIHHTINAGESSAAAAVAVRVEFLLGENVAAVLT